jgi:hypothetical protein
MKFKKICEKIKKTKVFRSSPLSEKWADSNNAIIIDLLFDCTNLLYKNDPSFFFVNRDGESIWKIHETDYEEYKKFEKISNEELNTLIECVLKQIKRIERGYSNGENIPALFVGGKELTRKYYTQML